MPKLTTADRKRIPRQQFAVSSKAPGPGSYPEPDKAHAVAAIGLAAMHGDKSAESKARALGERSGLIKSGLNK